MKAVVGRDGLSGGESVSSLPDAMSGGTSNCGVRTTRAEATMGGMSGGMDKLFSAAFDCKKGSGVRKDGLTVRALVGTGFEGSGDFTLNGDMPRVSGSVGVI